MKNLSISWVPDAVLGTGGRTTLLLSETIRFSGEDWQFTNNQTGKIKRGEEFSEYQGCRKMVMLGWSLKAPWRGKWDLKFEVEIRALKVPWAQCKGPRAGGRLE